MSGTDNAISFKYSFTAPDTWTFEFAISEECDLNVLYMLMKRILGIDEDVNYLFGVPVDENKIREGSLLIREFEGKDIVCNYGERQEKRAEIKYLGKINISKRFALLSEADERIVKLFDDLNRPSGEARNMIPPKVPDEIWKAMV